MIRFTKKNGDWVIESDRHLKRDQLVTIQTRKGERTVKVGKELAKPRGVQRHGTYVYEVAH